MGLASKQMKLILSRQPADMTETGNVKYKVSRVTQNRQNAANELIFKNITNYFRYPEIINIIKNKVANMVNMNSENFGNES